jgi:hypothetical protein
MNRIRKSAASHGGPICATLLLLGPILFMGCSTPGLGLEKSPVGTGFYFYTGDEDTAGELYLGMHEMRHLETGKTVLLIPMIHGADPAFYRTVQEKIDGADRVLTEGVWGVGSLSPTFFVIYYLNHNSRRNLSYMGLTYQNEGLNSRPNWQNADLSKADFQMSTPWWTPFAHAVMLPLWLVVLEPMNVGNWFNDMAHGAVGEGDTLEARKRHSLILKLQEETGEDVIDNFVLPGAITVRNAKVLAEFDRLAARPEIERIAIPWGSAHMKGLEYALVRKGYSLSRHEWLPAISVRNLLTGEGDGGETPSNFKIPYLVHWRSYQDDWSLATLFSLIDLGGGEEKFQFSLAWDLLFHLTSVGDEEEIQLLPSLFGRPLLFEWARRGEDTRFRFLLIFELGSLPGEDWKQQTRALP